MAHIIERWYVVFRSSLRGDSASCISHETTDKVRTLCGRSVEVAETLESDTNNLEPDCISCRRAAARRRKPRELQKPPEPEAPVVCAACAPGHRLGSLQPRCGVTGCECWCNR